VANNKISNNAGTKQNKCLFCCGNGRVVFGGQFGIRVEAGLWISSIVSHSMGLSGKTVARDFVSYLITGFYIWQAF
jgi:hypothetical protein